MLTDSRQICSSSRSFCVVVCADVNVKAAVGVEDMFVRRCEDLISFVEFGRWCWCAGMPWDSVALDVFEVELRPEWSVVAEDPPKILVGGPVRCWFKSVC